MKKVLITGARGFIGKNFIEGLRRTEGVAVLTYDRGDSQDGLRAKLSEADIVFHLAGINRPKEDAEFAGVNAGLTETLVAFLEEMKRFPFVVLASSTQAESDNPYGRSKKAAEDILIDYCKRNDASAALYRLPGVFGKWSRPNYNTVVATFCYNIARGFGIDISDAARELTLVYIDDVVDEFLSLLEHPVTGTHSFKRIARTYTVTLGRLAEKIHEFKRVRESLTLPDLSDEFTRRLYATYLSFLDKNDLSYPLDVKTDQRGSLFELLKSSHFGQVFLSKTRAGVVRGNHYHNSKIEKFCVLHGRAVIRLRNILSDEVVSYPVSGEKIEVVDIPPGYTHSIENTSDDELIVLFWSNQIFDPRHPDTHASEV